LKQQHETRDQIGFHRGPLPLDCFRREQAMSRGLHIFTAIGICALSIIAGLHYEGNSLVYLLFTLLANALLLNGLQKRSIYFDTFIGVFFWLGFWVKFSLRVAFASGTFRESVGAFDGSGEAFDQALLISSCAFAALLVASLIRTLVFAYPDEPSTCRQSGLFLFYQRSRNYFVGIFVLIVLLTATSNAWLGIYQRGMVTQFVLPYGLNGVFKWLLQFGLASVSALIVRFEIELNRNLSMTAVFPAILESFLSNVSLLSRGMILNSSALAIGGFRMISAMKRRVDSFILLVAAVAFALLFAVSVLAVNYLRSVETWKSAETASNVAEAKKMTSPLFIDRWVGIEGVMAVSSSKRLGWELWREAWKEEYREEELSLYDRTLVQTPYIDPNIDESRTHFVSLPGLVAFLYYPGSLGFLFAALLICALLAAMLEIATYRFCGRNWILCSLFAQVIAFRYASFGYVPAQSYLLFGSLVLNGFLILAADLLLRRFFAERRPLE
jgi:hypothetical protein